MSSVQSDPDLADGAAPGTAVAGWRFLTSVLARTTPQAVHTSANYRKQTLRLMAKRRKVVG